MSNDLVKRWSKARDDRRGAECWQKLDGKPDRIHGQPSFKISRVHCKVPMLMRCGQHTEGGQNYWESPDGLNAAILDYLVSNWESIYPVVIRIMEEKEREALINCQKYIDEMQQKIDEAKDEPPS